MSFIEKEPIGSIWKISETSKKDLQHLNIFNHTNTLFFFLPKEPSIDEKIGECKIHHYVQKSVRDLMDLNSDIFSQLIRFYFLQLEKKYDSEWAVFPAK